MVYFYLNTKTEPKENLPSECCNQSKDRKQNCLHGVSADSCSVPTVVVYTVTTFSPFSCEFRLQMGRNLPPDKLSRESCALFL